MMAFCHACVHNLDTVFGDILLRRFLEADRAASKSYRYTAEVYVDREVEMEE